MSLSRRLTFSFHNGIAGASYAGRTQYGRVRDDWGDWFGNDNSNLLWHYPIEERYLRRNRRAASDLGQAVGRLVEARRNLERLPASDALRHFLDQITAVDAQI